MAVYNSTKSTNSSYWIYLSIGNAGLPDSGTKEGDQGLTIITDLPEEVSLSFSSNWVPRMNASVKDILGIRGGLSDKSGINPMIQAATQQVWESTTPLEFPFTLLFDAYDNAKKNVFDPINALITYGLPSTIPFEDDNFSSKVASAGGNILYAPGPSSAFNYDTDKFAVKLRLGRMLYIPDGIMVGCQPKFDSRIAEDGYPVSGQVDITIRTSVVYSRTDWLKATSQGEPSTALQRGPR